MQDCLRRVKERKIETIVLAVIFLCFIVLGICCVSNPAIYDYHYNICERYIDAVCYTDRNVFVIFLERSCGSLLLLMLTLLAGVHFAACIVPVAILCYRAYTFGGSIFVLFGVYRFSGALIAVVLYLPIHLLTDVILLAAIALSFTRGRCFCFHKASFCEMLYDFLLLGALILLVYFLEMILLLFIFHPIGNII